MVKEARYDGQYVAPSETDGGVKLGRAILCLADA